MVHYVSDIQFGYRTDQSEPGGWAFTADYYKPPVWPMIAIASSKRQIPERKKGDPPPMLSRKEPLTLAHEIGHILGNIIHNKKWGPLMEKMPTGGEPVAR